MEDYIEWDGGSMDSSDNSAPVESNYELNDETAVVRAEMNALQTLMAEMQQNMQTFEVKRQGIGTSLQEIDEQRKALLAADRDIQTKTFDISRTLRKLEAEAAQKQRLLEQAEEQRRLRDEYLRLSDSYDRLTANAFWRGDAMTHQIEGGKKMAVGRRVLLGDKRGLGKTLTALIAADMLGSKKILCVVPGDVIRTFEREIHHWAPEREVAPLGMMPKAQRKFAVKMLKKLDKFIVTVNFEAWRKDFSLIEDLKDLQFDTIIIDEAHNIKDPKSVGYRGVEQIVFAANQCPECGGGATVEKSREYTWIMVPTCRECGNQSGKSEEAYDWCSLVNVFPMTGTPILNKPQDLFSLLSLIDRPAFNNMNTFLRDYCEQDLYTSKWKFRTGGLKSLTKKLAGKFLVRDRKSAGVVLPEQHEIEYELELTWEEYPEQMKFAKQLNDYAQIVLDEDKKMNILAMIALITRKRQMMTWPEGIKMIEPESGEVIFQVECKESIKVDRVIKIEELNNVGYAPVIGDIEGLIPELTADGSIIEGERVVLMSQFKEPLKEIERRCKLAGISVVRYDGDTPKNIQDEVVVDFDKRYCDVPDYNNGNGPKWQVLLANYKKGGVGLNLTAATQMIVLDEEWNPGKVDQAYGRIDRMGQDKETTVHVLRVQNSVDTWMKSIIAEKAAMISGFESAHNIAEEMLDAIRSGRML